MTDTIDHTEQDLRIYRYLYDDMAPLEREDFERDLALDADLQVRLAQEQAFDTHFPRGTQPVISEARLARNLAAVRTRAQTPDPGRLGLGDLLAAGLRRPAWVGLQLAALVAAFGLGLNLAAPGAAVPTGDTTLAQVSPLDLVGDDDYELYQLEVNRFDPATGTIDLTFALASETRVVGNVADLQVRSLIDAALGTDIEDGARLQAAELLQFAFDTRNASDAPSAGLMRAVTTDLNPGVRYAAATTLAGFADQPPVRAALRQALQTDVNPGVRLVAFDALATEPDPGTLDVFRQRMVADSNEYIRTRARAIVESVDGAPGLF